VGGHFVPFALVVEATEGADGAEDVVAGGDNPLGILNDVFESEVDTAGAAAKEPCRMGVAIDGVAVGDSKVRVDPSNRAPQEEGFLDGFAFGVLADGAEALVTVEVWYGAPLEEDLCFAIYLIIHSNYPFSEHNSTKWGGFQGSVPWKRWVERKGDG